MKISTRGQYGVRFMIDLAVHAAAPAVSLGEVAQRQGISEKYLWQIVASLKAAGIVQSVRGARGGYRLARAPSTISLREIVTVIEGSITLTDQPDDGTARDLGSSAVVREMWKDLSDTLANAMEAIKLNDLVERCRASNEAASQTYEI